MSQPRHREPIDLRNVAAAAAIVIAVGAAAALVYLLLDILLLLFLGIVIAAVLQPWHLWLGRWGIPRGVAVLLIYMLLAGSFVVVAVVVGPALIEGITHFVATLPDKYASFRVTLASGPVVVRALAAQLPSVERLVPGLAKVAPQFYGSAIELTSRTVDLVMYSITVLALAFYWTMEVPRFERFALSFVPVDKRTRALVAWHEIESKLGAYMRGQGLAMLVIGVASGVGYALVGLPNVLTLAVMAGLLEAVPVLGPVLASVPALLVALPLGFHAVILVIGWAVMLQLTENYFLMPRIMAHTVGVSAMVSLVAVLAFGTLYGIVGVFIAIPMAAVLQVVLESMMETAPLAEATGRDANPWSGLSARVNALREEARGRLRGRTSRMGIDPGTPDHVVDAVDQQIEEAAERVETVIAGVQDKGTPLGAEEKRVLVDLETATERIGEIAGQNAVDTDSSSPSTEPNEEVLTGLREATKEMERVTERVETVVVERGAAKASAEALGDPGERSSGKNLSGAPPINSRR